MFPWEGLGSVTDLASGRRIGGAALAGRVAARAARQRDRGLVAGDRVLLVTADPLYFIEELLATWLVGGCVAAVDHSVTPPEFTTLVNFVEPKLVLSDASREGAPGLARIVLDDTELPAGDAPSAIAAEPARPALILFTSGTTGDPKGVLHTVGSLTARLSLNRAYIPAAALRRGLCVLPLHFGHGLIGNVLTPLSAGGDVLILPRPGVPGAARMAQLVGEHGIAMVSAPPAFWRMTLRMSPPPPGGVLQHVGIGSAPVSRDLMEDVARWSGTRNVWNMYGITETANWAAGYSLASGDAADGLVGSMWGGEAGLRLADGSIARSGEGEIALRTPSVMAGYFRRDDLSAETLRDGWYFTGDSGVVDDAGSIRLTGRIKDEINRGGLKIAPSEIDLLLQRHPAVAEACAFAVPDPMAGEIVGVAVVLEAGQQIGPQELRDWCSRSIRRECVPECWFVVAAIPKTERGKVNRNRVRDTCLKA